MSDEAPGSHPGGVSSGWTVERELAALGQWRRWLVRDGRRRGRRLLVSILKRGQGTEVDLDRALRRAERVRGIVHPGLSRVREHGSIPGGVWVVEEIGQRVPLSVSSWRGSTVGGMMRILEALAHVHQQGVVHGQISAETVLSGPQGALLSGLVLGGAGRAAGEPEVDVRAWARVALQVLEQRGPSRARSPQLWQLLGRAASGTGWVPGDGRRMMEQLQAALSADAARQATRSLIEAQGNGQERPTMRERILELVSAFVRGALSTVLTLALLAATGAIAFMFAMEGGPREVVVPNLLGMEYQAAVDRIREEGLVVGPLRRGYYDDVEPNHIAAMNPPPGMRVREGREIALVVSQGSAEVEVPLLVGLQVAEAQDLLGKAGLALKKTGERRADGPVGEVLSQRPAPGARVGRGTEVAVVVSGGEDYGLVRVSDSTGQVRTILFRELEVIVGEGPRIQRVTVLQGQGEAAEIIYDRPHRPGDKVTVPVEGSSGTQVEVRIEGQSVYKTQL